MISVASLVLHEYKRGKGVTDIFVDNERKKHPLVQAPGKMSPYMGFQVSFLAVVGEARTPGGRGSAAERFGLFLFNRLDVLSLVSPPRRRPFYGVLILSIERLLP